MKNAVLIFFENRIYQEAYIFKCDEELACGSMK